MMHSKKILYFTLSLACFLLAFLLSMIALRGRDEALAAHLAPQVLRFHVLANSDSGEDQALKIEVKSLLLGYLEDSLPADASLEETKHYIGEHLGELEQTAERYMREKGFSYSADARLTRCYFPTKIYGDLVFPSGEYEALRVSLGEGAGQNWWCVLYPALCFTEPEQAVVPPQSKELLRDAVSAEDYRKLENERRLRWSDKRPRIRLLGVEAVKGLLGIE